MVKFYNGSATIDDSLLLRKADEEFYKFIGHDIYASINQCIHPDDLHRFLYAVKELGDKNMPKNIVSVRIKRVDGKYRWVLIELSFEPFDIEGKALINLKIVDIAESENSNNEIKRINNEYDTYLGLLDGIMFSYDMDTCGLDIFMNSGGQRIYMYQGTLSSWKEDLLDGKVDEEYVSAFNSFCADIEAGKKNFKYEIKTKAFSQKECMETCMFKCQTIRSAGRSYKVLGCVGLYGEDRENELLLGMEYNKDSGLDVLNKKAITDYAKKLLISRQRSRVYIAIIDLDNFKNINDTFGHMFGDEVLSTVADIIKDAVGNRGIVGRIGGDELLVVLDKIDEHTELRNMLRTIRTNVEWAYKGKRDDVVLTCSIGVAMYPDNGDTYEKVFQLADRMLYKAKEKGKNRYVIYIPEIHDAEFDTGKKEHLEDSIAKLKSNKTGVIQRLIEQFLIKKIVTYETMLNEIGYAFGLDDIVIAYDNFNITTTWNHDGVYADRDSFKFLEDKKEFWDSFDNNNIYVMNGLYVMEVKFRYLYDLLKDRKIESAIFYKMVKNGNMIGMIMFAKVNNRMKWSEYEKTIMAVIGKTIEISFTDR